MYFGEGAYGIYAAAHTFFGVDPAQLDPGAGRHAGRQDPLAPAASTPARTRRRCSSGATRSCGRWHKHGWLSQPDLDGALAEPMTLAPPQPPGVSRVAPLRRLRQAGSQRPRRARRRPRDPRTKLFTGGYTIETTLDPKLFDATTAAVQTQLGEPGDPITAVASVVPGDGAIDNLFGGLDYLTTQFGYADRGLRQPGSAFKPFVYLAALRDGIDPRSVFDGTSGRRIPCYGDRPVNNYAGEDFGGSHRRRHARWPTRSTSCSSTSGARSVCATWCGPPPTPASPRRHRGPGGRLPRWARPGREPAVDGRRLRHLRLRRRVRRALRHQGDPRQPGQGRLRAQRKTHRAFEANQVGVLNDALQRVVVKGRAWRPASAARWPARPARRENNVDAWFAGYVPQVATAVWVGYDPARPMTNVHHRARHRRQLPGGHLRRPHADRASPTFPSAACRSPRPTLLHLRRLGEFRPRRPPAVAARPRAAAGGSAAGGDPSTEPPPPDSTTTTTTKSRPTTTTTAPSPTTTTTKPPPSSTTTTTP